MLKKLHWHKHLLSCFLTILSMLLSFESMAEEDFQVHINSIDLDSWLNKRVSGNYGNCDFDTQLIPIGGKYRKDGFGYRKDGFEYQTYIIQDYCSDDSLLISATLQIRRPDDCTLGTEDDAPWQLFKRSFTLREFTGEYIYYPFVFGIKDLRVKKWEIISESGLIQLGPWSAGTKLE